MSRDGVKHLIGRLATHQHLVSHAYYNSELIKDEENARGIELLQQHKVLIPRGDDAYTLHTTFRRFLDAALNIERLYGIGSDLGVAFERLEQLTREWESRQKMVEQAKEIIRNSTEEARATGNSAAAAARSDKALEALAARYGISKEQLDKYIKSNDDFAKKMKEVADANATATSSELAKAQALAFGETALKKQAIEAEKAFQEKQRRWAIEDARGTGGNFSAPVVQGYEAIRQAAIGAAAAQGQFGTDLDMVAKQVVALGGELKVGVPILLQVKEATEQVTKAFLDAAVAARTLREEQAQALDVTKGWTDYVIGLKEGYDNGVTSLTTYISLLGDFRAQITQMFAGATGDAAEAVKALQDLIAGLMSNIGPRAAGSGNRQLDDLNRAIDAAKNRKK